MTKREAITKLKAEWRTAPTTTKMKTVKALYTEVKNLDITDSELIPEAVEKKIISI